MSTYTTDFPDPETYPYETCVVYEFPEIPVFRDPLPRPKEILGVKKICLKKRRSKWGRRGKDGPEIHTIVGWEAL